MKFMRILWPSFLMACVLEMFVFNIVDPSTLVWFGHAIDASRLGAYTVGFFIFWTVTALSSGLTLLLCASAAEVNERS